MNIAFVYDRVNKFGGAERVLLALHEIWPKAPLYTAVYDRRKASWARVFRVHPSFIQMLPFAASRHEWYAWLTPMAFESFSFDSYDVVLSVTSAEAKDIITKLETVHVCYCLTPTRYLWSESNSYERAHIGVPSLLSRTVYRRLLPTLKRWDVIGASRPDRYIAISRRVKKRIESYYHREVDAVIYPPADVKTFVPPRRARSKKSGAYYLLVSRLVWYKRVDLVIDAFNALQWPLVVIGDGLERRLLMRRAKKNVQFIFRHLTDEELVNYYQNCRALVFAGEEDFGLVAAEAQACGIPVIAYKESGIAEIIQDGKTGILFPEKRVSSLIDALKKAEHTWYDSTLCRNNAMRFSLDRFKKEMKSTIERFS